MKLLQRQWLVLLLLLLLSTATSLRGPSKQVPAAPSQKEVPSKEADLDELQQEEKLVARKEERMDQFVTLIGVATTFATTLYGCVLLVMHNHFRRQIFVMTVVRAAGFIELERAAWELRRNIRRSIRTAVLNAPSLLLMRRALRDLQRRKSHAKKILHQTQLAEADGVVTRREARKIRKMQRKQVQRIRQDIRRLRRGSSTIAKLWRKLDLKHASEIIRRLIFMVAAVLASGHSISTVGKVISGYCRFWSLGQFLMETNYRLGMPLSKFIIKRTIDPMSMTISDEDPSIVRVALGVSLMYALSALIVLFRFNFGLRLNASFLSASLILRGLTGVLAVLDEIVQRKERKDDSDEDDDKDRKKDNDKNKDKNKDKKDKKPEDVSSRVKVYAIPGMKRKVVVPEFFIGISTLLLVASSMYCSYKLETTPPPWLDPLVAVEEVIGKLVVLADKM